MCLHYMAIRVNMEEEEGRMHLLLACGPKRKGGADTPPSFGHVRRRGGRPFLFPSLPHTYEERDPSLPFMHGSPNPIRNYMVPFDQLNPVAQRWSPKRGVNWVFLNFLSN